jgi:hypothetical protein
MDDLGVGGAPTVRGEGNEQDWDLCGYLDLRFKFCGFGFEEYIANWLLLVDRD